MPVIEVSGKNLLDAVRQMTSDEFDTFIDHALSLRARPKPSTLSAEESRLIKRINRGLPVELTELTKRLVRRRTKGVLTHDEHQELLDLTRRAESQDADRAAALLELAKLRRLPIRTLMKQMGIEPLPIHG